MKLTSLTAKQRRSLFDIESAINIEEYTINSEGATIEYIYDGNEKTLIVSEDDLPLMFEKVGFIDKWLPGTQRVKNQDDDTFGYRYVDYLDWMNEQRWTRKDALRLAAQHEWDLAAYRLQQEGLS